MANMNYCKFENTAAALEQCLPDMESTDLSESENKGRQRLLDLIGQVIDESGADDLEGFDRWIQKVCWIQD